MKAHSITHSGRWTTAVKLGLLLVTAAVLALVAPGTTHAASFTVNSTADTDDGSCDPLPRPGDCTLREAIHAANASAGTDTIGFNIPGAGVKTIKPLSDLPFFADPFILDGYTQPGASPNTLAVGNNATLLIELDGSLQGEGSPGYGSGLHVLTDNSTVRGLVINHFNLGVWVGSNDRSVEGVIVSGNFIGTDPSGTIPLAEQGYGVCLCHARKSTIGGTSPAERNVISGFNTGIRLEDPDGQNQVEGNYIGTDKHGTSPVANVTGIQVVISWHNTIGGNSPGSRNIISGNSEVGILVYGGMDNQIVGNFIGTDATGSAPLGNGGDGIQESWCCDPADLIGATYNIIGGSRGKSNLIAFNGTGGIYHDGLSTVLQNSIHSNGGLGIDLYAKGPTLNDLPDLDEWQNFPVITEAKSASHTISGKLIAKDNQDFLLHFYANTACDPSGYGEGRVYLGAATVHTSLGGVATFSKTAKAFNPGDRITATATDQYGRTSEFSKCKVVAPNR